MLFRSVLRQPGKRKLSVGKDIQGTKLEPNLALHVVFSSEQFHAIFHAEDRQSMYMNIPIENPSYQKDIIYNSKAIMKAKHNFSEFITQNLPPVLESLCKITYISLHFFPFKTDIHCKFYRLHSRQIV